MHFGNVSGCVAWMPSQNGQGERAEDISLHAQKKIQGTIRQVAHDIDSTKSAYQCRRVDQ